MYDPTNTHNQQQIPRHYGNNLDNRYSTDHGTLQFRPNNNQESNHENDDDSGVCSPPLWKNSPSPSHPLLNNYYDHKNNNNYRCMSPDSRTQAIVRGQWELMEMVKNMPESSYELSLKDLVEHHHRADMSIIQSSSPDNNNNLQQRVRHKVVKQEIAKKPSADSKSVVTRNGSFERKSNKNSNNNKGLVLNLVFPFSLKKATKKKGFNGNSSGRVSPRPDVGLNQKDWWKKKFTGSTDSDSSRTSSNSGGSSGSTTSSGASSVGGGNREKNGVVGGCWPCFKSRTRRSKIVE